MPKPIGVLRAALYVAAILAAACAEDEGLMDSSPVSSPDAGGQGLESVCSVMVNDKACDMRKRPIVFIHGSRSAGDSFEHPALLFASNGYCSQRIRAIDYDAITRDETGSGYPAIAAQLDALIADLLDVSGAKKVDLVAHAQGAAYGTRYASMHPDKVAHYVHLAGGQLSTNPGGVPTLCLSSVADRPVKCGTSRNVTFEDSTIDHFAVCSSRQSFREIYAFLNDGVQPMFDTVQCGEPVVVEGRAITYGDNQKMSGGRVEVYALGEAPWARAEPITTLVVREDGSVGPWTVERGVAYEFKLIPGDGDDRKPRYAYFPPFVRTDRLLRFTFESRHPAALATSRMANLHDRTAALWVRRKQGSFQHGRDRLMVNGFQAINELDAMPTATITGLYVLDQNGDAQSSGGSVLRETFVNGTDVYLQAEQPAFIDVELNGQKLQVPNWPSQSGGLSMVWFD